ncbi:hypothetical protein VNI00_010247 [Paramarasmius palmivorus]|uniref:Uncharacterized protein n=1 Tax=Paramarasmius palmivorus TaxID=297713 RepID=A0AAW0CLI7_9AGAR
MDPSRPSMPSFQSAETVCSIETIVATVETNVDSSNKNLKEGKSTETEKSNSVSSNTKVLDNEAYVVQDVNKVPDGGFRAWLVVFGISCCSFTTYGLTGSWGVFQAFYQHSLLTELPPSDIAWIGSIQYFLTFIPCMIVGRLFDMGYLHSIFIASSAMLIAATILVGPLAAIVSQWFKEKRALALGICSAGTSLGGTILPVIARTLLPRIGFMWTMRVFALIELVALSITNISIRRRLPPTYPEGPLLGIKPLKSLPFAVYCAATFFVFVGFYTFTTYIASTAVSKGISETFSYNLVAILNGSSGISRIAAGVVASYTGPMNHMIPFTIVAGIVILCWPAVETQSAFIAIAIALGFSNGSYNALLWQPIIDLGDKDELSRRVAILMLSLGCAGLFGPSISGEVNKEAGVRAMGIYAGVCTLIGVMLALMARHMMLRSVFGKI